MAPHERERRRSTMASVNVRMPVEFLDWIHDQAVEDDTNMSDVIRSCVAAAIVDAGDAKRYGIAVEEHPS